MKKIEPQIEPEKKRLINTAKRVEVRIDEWIYIYMSRVEKFYNELNELLDRWDT